MTFELTIHGDSPAELLTTLQQLITAPQETAEPPAKPKTPRRKENPKCTTVTTTAAPEAPATTSAKSESGTDVGSSTPFAPASAPDESQESTPAQTAPSEATVTVPSSEPAKDPGTIQKILDLARPLSAYGHKQEVRAIVAATGAERISEIPPERYTEVWEKLLQLKDEVDKDAAD